MSEVLVLVDHVDGAVKKPTYELLTIARRLGEPSAVFIGDAGKSADVAEKVKKYGAEKVYVVDDAEIKGYLVAPKAEALQQLAEKTSPARDPDPLVVRGQGDRGPAGDQARVRADHRRRRRAGRDGGAPVTTQSVFAGNYTVTAKVTQGTPIITVKPNAAAPEESEGAGAVEEFAADRSPTPRRPRRSSPPSRARPPAAPS